ncbi:LuxR family transcriptional regulator [Chromobacterium phragmitis]|uniref:LuxR family transcriptional regulator n=1 Tax=Chromobacterium phragmitis TaxID=2202141 RepID=A0A344UMD8_9NEIS|nr:LysR family transcriptional regulator [Chromobacterium phragmitis]AXE31049.1 LuxR family transcriptional regulator [Chromobacterium phragmitis]AXE36436.1 LuxR family transcriptional regulator [Chromobacterium phragmitis]
MKSALGQVSDFDIRLLRLFRAVAECGGFSAAEGVLGISRSAISLQMGDLEKRLGIRLCQRGRAGFALTDEGREVLRASQTLLAALEDFRGEVNLLHRQLRGELNIGIVNNLVTLPRMRVTGALKALSEQGPEVKISIGMMTPSDIETGLLDGQLHAGVVPLIQPLSGLDYLPLYEERSQLYCSREHPLFSRPDADMSEADLAAANAVAPGYRLPPQAQALQQRLTPAATASDREGIAFLILSGRYIGYLPDHFAAAWVAQGMMRPLRPDICHYDAPLALAVRRGRRANLVLERFLQELERHPA